MLWRYRLPFMVMPIAVTVWYMSMDVANGLMQNTGFDWQFTRDVSLVFGLGTCAVAMWVDVRNRQAQEAAWRQDYAYWLYMFGAIMFWCGLSLRDSSDELGKFLFAVLNVALVLLGVWWQRHEAAINARLSRYVPAGLRPIPEGLPQRR